MTVEICANQTKPPDDTSQHKSPNNLLPMFRPRAFSCALTLKTFTGGPKMPTSISFDLTHEGTRIYRANYAILLKSEKHKLTIINISPLFFFDASLEATICQEAFRQTPQRPLPGTKPAKSYKLPWQARANLFRIHFIWLLTRKPCLSECFLWNILSYCL